MSISRARLIKPHWMQLAVALFCLLFVCHSALARPELGPPSIKLRSNVSNVVVAQFDERRERDLAVFTKIQDLHNEAPAQIELRMDPQWIESLEAGQSYILAYIGWTSQRLVKKLEPRADGPVLINLPGAAPAIFADSAIMRDMLSWNLEDSLQSPLQILDLIRQGLRSEDWQYQMFFVTEIATRPNLHGALSAADRVMVAELAKSPSSPPYVAQFLFQHGDFLGSAFDAVQRSALAREILSCQALYQDPLSLYPSMIRSAMHYLKRHGEPEDAAVLVRWLQSNQTGLVEGALEALRELDLDRLPDLIEQALSQTLVHRDKRQLLKNYQRRVDAIRQQQ